MIKRMCSTRNSALQVSGHSLSGRSLVNAMRTGLSLLGYPALDDLDPVYCMPASIIEARGLRKDWQALPRRSTIN